jgi:hypothetical protein
VFFIIEILRLPPARRLKDDCLVGVREATHTRHNAEDVVVEGVDADLGRARADNRVERDREL